MEEYDKEISRIKELLASSPEGLSITELAGLLRINRNSVAKYLDILRIQGSVDGRRRGTSKVFYLSERLPASALRKACPLPFVMVNQDLIVMDMNPPFLTYLRTPADQILQHSCENLPVDFLDAGPPAQVLRGAMKGTEQRLRGQIQIETKMLPVSFLLLPVVFESGRPGLCLIVEGPSMGVQQDKAAAHEQDLLALLDDQMEYVIRYTPEGIIWFVNQTYCQAVGKTREDLMGRPFKPLVSDEDTRRILAHRSQLSPHYPVGTIEYRAIMANGESRYQRWQDRAMFNSRGELVGFNSCGIDITDGIIAGQKLKKTQETLEESIFSRTEDLRSVNRQLYDEIARREKTEEQLLLTQFAMDHAADMIFWIGREGRLEYANTVALQVLGYEKTELPALVFGDLAPRYALNAWAILWNDLKQGLTVAAESGLRKKNGDLIPAELKFSSLQYRGREFVYCFSRDISERTRMERAIQEANKKLNVLTSLARHDIQNKITVLLGYLGRMKKATQDPVMLEYLERQEQAAKAISSEINLTREFKDLGRQPPEWQDLSKIVNNVINKYSQSGIRVTVDLPATEIYADLQVDRVFLRILEVMKDLSETADHVKINAGKDGQSLRIVLEDNGKGLPLEEKDSIFEFQTDIHGTGRLFIAREILSVTGITLTENGRTGQGSHFIIRIPSAYYRYPAEKA